MMRFLWITLTVLFIDQATKAAVYLNMYPGQSIALLGDWFRLTFTQNPGMAFGITLGVPQLVPVLAVVATTLIVLYIIHVRNGYAPYVASLMAILGGALGNIIDRVFYGMIFGYSGFFEGRVVDFIHFNVWRGIVPESIPLLGGSPLALFPIWNVADMAIVLGVVGILIFQKEFHAQLDASKESSDADSEIDAIAELKSDASPAEPEVTNTPAHVQEPLTSDHPGLPSTPQHPLSVPESTNPPAP